MTRSQLCLRTARRCHGTDLLKLCYRTLGFLSIMETPAQVLFLARLQTESRKRLAAHLPSDRQVFSCRGREMTRLNLLA
jgi:hypothetical protein